MVPLVVHPWPTPVQALTWGSPTLLSQGNELFRNGDVYQ
jgi:hypothetical protein